METLVLVIPSTGTYPGIWSRSLCISEGLLRGTMLPFFHRAMEENMGIIVLNPNVTSSLEAGTSERKPIPYNDTPEKHVLYVWDRIVSLTTAKNILILAYGQGGNHAKALIQAREGTILEKLRAVAFTQSLHTLHSDLSFGLSGVESKQTRDFLENHALNWIASDLPIGERDYVVVLARTHAQEEEERLGCICVSAAPSSSNPALLNYVAMSQVFDFFHYACSDVTHTTEQFWETFLHPQNSPPRNPSDSDNMKTTNEVLVTNLPLSTHWVPDSIVSLPASVDS